MKKRKKRKVKQPSFVRQVWDLHVERCKTRKALRLLSKQEWSVEFLTAMLLRAANLSHQPLEMTITNNNTSIRVNTHDNVGSTYRDDSIFNHLDDNLRVEQFIASVNA